MLLLFFESEKWWKTVWDFDVSYNAYLGVSEFGKYRIAIYVMHKVLMCIYLTFTYPTEKWNSFMRNITLHIDSKTNYPLDK